MIETAMIARGSAGITPRDDSGEPLPFEVATTVWLTGIADLSPRTLALYRENVSHFADWCTERGIAGVNLLTPADLVALHLLEDDYPAASWNRTGGTPPLQHPITTFVEGVNGTTMGAFRKSTCYEDGKVYLDTSQLPRSSYFDGVPEDMWNFHIGGYQVCRK